MRYAPPANAVEIARKYVEGAAARFYSENAQSTRLPPPPPPPPPRPGPQRFKPIPAKKPIPGLTIEQLHNQLCAKQEERKLSLKLQGVLTRADERAAELARQQALAKQTKERRAAARVETRREARLQREKVWAEERAAKQARAQARNQELTQARAQREQREMQEAAKGIARRRAKRQLNAEIKLDTRYEMMLLHEAHQRENGIPSKPRVYSLSRPELMPTIPFSELLLWPEMGRLVGSFGEERTKL